LLIRVPLGSPASGIGTLKACAAGIMAPERHRIMIRQ
jgi:hypothetical protein